LLVCHCSPACATACNRASRTRSSRYRLAGRRPAAVVAAGRLGDAPPAVPAARGNLQRAAARAGEHARTRAATSQGKPSAGTRSKWKTARSLVNGDSSGQAGCQAL
jgi:hypothetical protein